MNDKYDLTTGTIWKKLLIYFLPIVAGSIFQQLYNAVDAIIVGKFVGTQALAAVGGSASLICNIIINFFVALSGGATVVIAQYFGAGDDADVSKASHTAIAFSVFSGILMTIAGLLLAPWLLNIMSTPEDTMADSITYLRIFFAGTLFVLLFNIGSGILRAVGDSRRPFIYLCVSCVTNIILDLVLVLFCDMGVAGVAIATVVAQAISVVFIMLRLCRAKESYRIELKKIKIYWELFGRMMKIGLPSGCQSLLYGISNSIVQVAINSLSTVAVASWALSGKIDGIFWASSNAAGVAIMNFVGQCKGAGDMERVKGCTRTSFKMFGAMTIGMSTAILLLAKFLLTLFTDDAEVILTTWHIITYFVPVYFTWIIIEILSAVLRGVGDSIPPTIICAIGICGVRMLWILTVCRISPNILNVSLTYPISWVITDIAMITYYRKGKWQKARID